MTDNLEDNAMQILNALAPLSRKDEWWSTDGPVAVVARELRRMYPKSKLATLADYNQHAQLGPNYATQLPVQGLVR